MKKMLFLAIAMAILFFSCTVYVRETPVPSAPVLLIKSKPALVVIPGHTRFFYTEEYGCSVFFFDGRWFIYENDFWYVSQFWNGPFTHIKNIPPGLVKARTRLKELHHFRDKKDNDGKHGKSGKDKGKGKGRGN